MPSKEEIQSKTSLQENGTVNTKVLFVGLSQTQQIHTVAELKNKLNKKKSKNKFGIEATDSALKIKILFVLVS